MGSESGQSSTGGMRQNITVAADVRRRIPAAFCNFRLLTSAATVLKIKKPAEKLSGLLNSDRDYLVPRIASFAAFATRNFTTRLALIWIASPVAGLRDRKSVV